MFPQPHNIRLRGCKTKLGQFHAHQNMLPLWTPPLITFAPLVNFCVELVNLQIFQKLTKLSDRLFCTLHVVDVRHFTRRPPTGKRHSLLNQCLSHLSCPLIPHFALNFFDKVRCKVCVNLWCPVRLVDCNASVRWMCESQSPVGFCRQYTIQHLGHHQQWNNRLYHGPLTHDNRSHIRNFQVPMIPHSKLYTNFPSCFKTVRWPPISHYVCCPTVQKTPQCLCCYDSTDLDSFLLVASVNQPLHHR